MADNQRHRIKNLLQKLNDEDRNSLLLLISESWLCGKDWKRAAGRKRTDNVLCRVLGGGR